MDVCISRASAVIVQRVPEGAVEWFMDWQRRVTEAAETFEGYGATEVYPPADGRHGEWVVVIHFDDDRCLQLWLDSPVRSQWLEKLQAKVGNFKIKKLPDGFGPWFTGLNQTPPASWKMALTVLLGLYPTVMLLTFFVSPFTNPWGLAVSMLIGNALSVSILQWGVMPLLSKILGPWLNARTREKMALSLAGLGVIVVVLVVMAALFRLVKG